MVMSKFRDLIDTDKLQRLMDLFYRATHIPVGIIDAGGTFLVTTGWQEICTRFHRVHPVSAERCRENDDYIRSSLGAGKCAARKCKNGLWNLGIPIVISDEHLATLFLGQFFYEDEKPDEGFFRRQAEELGFDSREYMRVLGEVPIFSREKVHDIMEYYSEFVGFLSLLGMKNQTLAQDIKLREQTERALRESEEKHRLVVENGNDAIFVAQDGVLKFSNRKAEELFGYSSDELSRIPFADHLHPEDRDLVMANHLKRVEGGELPNTYSFRVFDKGGHEHCVEINAVRIAWNDRPAVLSFIRDTTLQKKLEAQLIQAQKMEAVGTLAGGIAHDFNNSLQVISGYTQLLQLRQGKEKSELDLLMGIERAVQRSRALVQQLFTFSRKNESSFRPIDLNYEVSQIKDLLGRTMPKMIDVELYLGKDVKRIKGDVSQVEQVLMNIAINAGHAMPDGGRLIFETENVGLDQDYCETHLGIKAGDYVLLTVSDTGAGMDRATKERIFEPFFTTKEAGTGTGLGLTMVYGIVRSHGGLIMCYSEPRQGTTFKIYFPAFAGEGLEAGEGLVREEEIAGGNERILLVDDEEPILSIAQSMLERFGYETLAARNGEEALGILRERKGQVDLVILDLSMPGMGGHRCLKEIREIYPGLKVIIASGYSSNGSVKETLASGASGFVGKPFHMKDMLSIIRKVLDRK